MERHRTPICLNLSQIQGGKKKILSHETNDVNMKVKPFDLERSGKTISVTACYSYSERPCFEAKLILKMKDPAEKL